jgi:dimethylhistidine N-methyltransferase
MRDEVIAGLTKPGQKELPSKYFYDAVGSHLYEAITELAEYGLTRAEERVLRTHAREIVLRMPEAAMVAELGSGSGRKTRYLLEALSRRHPTAYYPIEISPRALAMCEREVGGIAAVSVVGVECEYLEGLRAVAARRRDAQPLLVLFLGSTLGNFDGPMALCFLKEVRGILAPGDALLLGTDLQKPVRQMLLAYDDPAGVTAAFNMNLLARINRELDADFDLAKFEHEARFNAGTSSIEMHLRSRCAQQVSVAGVGVRFEAGETIWTESSHKYAPGEIEEMARASDFCCRAQWTDQEWLFADTLLIAVEPAAASGVRMTGEVLPLDQR